MPAPNADFFIARLGQALTTVPAEVFEFATKPDFNLPAHSPIGGIFFKQLGFSITFCPREFYHGKIDTTNDAPIITNIQIYSGAPEFNHQAYTGTLPLGISFRQNRESLWKTLGASSWAFPFVEPLTLERWDFADYWLLVAYADDMASIKMIQIGLHAQKAAATVLPKIMQPDIATLQSWFGQPWQQISAMPLLQDCDFSDLAHIDKDDQDSHEVSALETHGLELYFRPSLASGEDFYVFTGARYLRKGLHFSSGFDGALPKGLLFSDTLTTLLHKVGSYPVTGSANILSGYYVWQLPEYLLQVGFSVMEQRINRIRVAAHPYYSQDFVTSPLLRHPA